MKRTRRQTKDRSRNQREACGPLELLILLALNQLGADAYGLSVQRAIAKRTGRKLAGGSISTTLRRFETRQLVTSQLSDSTPVRGGRRKRHFKLRPRGLRLARSTLRMIRRMSAGLTW
jgi:DNA-binding PadR family transcriptional regulator